MALTLSTKEHLLQLLLGFVTSGGYNPCYIGLSTTAPSQYTGSNFTEPWEVDDPDNPGTKVATGYYRFLLDQASPSIAHMTIDHDCAYNKDMIEFGETFYDYPDTVKYFGLFTSATGGTPFITGKLDNPVTVHKTEMPIFSKSTSFSTANLKFSISDGEEDQQFDVIFTGGLLIVPSGSTKTITSLAGKYTLPDPTEWGWAPAAGCEFDGWALNSSGTGTIYQPGEEYDLYEITQFYAICHQVS